MAHISKDFYESAYQGEFYAPPKKPEEHAFYQSLKKFIDTYKLYDKRCLEVGTGRGAFQHLLSDYTGIDIATSAGNHIHKPFTAASATSLPFSTQSFDGIWTITVLEHVPNPEKALLEMWRVLKPGGYLFLAPAWQCRSWAAQGYPVRPYSDFNWKGKLVKASIPVRNSVAYRAVSIFPQRLIRLLIFDIKKKPGKFHYRELEANFETFWMSDSDAVNSMDPFEAYIWFLSRNAKCLNYPSIKSAFLIRNGPIIFQKLNN